MRRHLVSVAVVSTLLAAAPEAAHAEPPTVRAQVGFGGQSMPSEQIMFAVEPRLALDWPVHRLISTYAFAGIGAGSDTNIIDDVAAGWEATLGGGFALHGDCLGELFCGGVRLGGGLQYADYHGHFDQGDGHDYTSASAFLESEAYVSISRFSLGLEARRYLVLGLDRQNGPTDTSGEGNLSFGGDGGWGLAAFVGFTF